MSGVRVSVLLPIWNAAATFTACLRSIQRQTETRFECIIVDDGSVDGSLEIARAWAQRDPRFRLHALPHRGLVSALRAGVVQCRAPAIARMDGDDLMHRDRLAAQLSLLESQPALAAVGSHVRCFPREALGPGMRRYERWLAEIDTPARVRTEAFVECPVAHPTLMLRAEVLSAFPYRDRGWPEDYDLILRILEAGHEVGVVPRRLLAWRHTPDRLSRRSGAYSDARFTACKAHFLARSFLAKRERYVLWGYGGTGRALHRELRERGKRPSAIVEVNPRRIGQTIHGAPVIPPEKLPARGGDPLVVSVAGTEARRLIRNELARAQYREGLDYVCAA